MFDEQRAKLEKEKLLLLSEIKQNERSVDFGDDTEDWDEEADKSEAVGDQLAVADDLKKRLAEVEIALEKIRTGIYGVCEKCGQKIEAKILEIDPESRFCKQCKLG